MAENNRKSPGRSPTADWITRSGSGRVGRDDRGNMTWEWAEDEELQADDTFGASQRLRALVDPNLKIADDYVTGSAPVRSNPKGLKKGYDPYDSGELGKKERKKKKNLRELSKWIELRRKTRGKEPDDTPDDPDQEP
jgi:hypothetical protein